MRKYNPATELSPEATFAFLRIVCEEVCEMTKGTKSQQDDMIRALAKIAMTRKSTEELRIQIPAFIAYRLHVSRILGDDPREWDAITEVLRAIESLAYGEPLCLTRAVYSLRATATRYHKEAFTLRPEPTMESLRNR